ncbi:substrate-binding periplasmic protein [Pseudoalteromonas sp. T1lg65]|uniref:substrate-binding periplasmic protein n=1 Tax=Pseudoalteromonas sp. T1lg65 TaxID=2077101 RepID=UPI003F798191
MQPYRVLCFIMLLCATQQSIAQCEIVKLSGNTDSPPLSFAASDTQLDGIGYKFIQQILPSGLKTEVMHPMPWLRAIKWAKDGKIDILVGIKQSESIANQLTYLSPELTSTAHNVFYVRGRNVIRDSNHLTKLQGAILKGSLLEGSDNSRVNLSNLTLSTADSVVKALKMLEYKRVDYIIAPQWQTINTWIKSGMQLKLSMLAEPIIIRKEYIAISNQSPCLKHKAAFETAIKHGKESGLLERLLDESFVDSDAARYFHELTVKIE